MENTGMVRKKQEAVNGGRSKVPWPSPWGRWEGFPEAVSLEVWLEGWVKVWHFNQETEFVLDRSQKSVVLRNRWDCQYAWNTNSRQHPEETEDSLERKTGLGFEELCLLHEELGRFMQESGLRRLVLWKHSSGIYVENGLVDGWGGHHEAATALKTEVMRAWAGDGEVGLDGRRQWW